MDSGTSNECRDPLLDAPGELSSDHSLELQDGNVQRAAGLSGGAEVNPSEAVQNEQPARKKKGSGQVDPLATPHASLSPQKTHQWYSEAAQDAV